MMEFSLFYIALSIVFVIGGLDSLHDGRPYQKVCFCAILILLVVLAGFRSIGTGSDDEAYIQIFSKIPRLSECRDLLCGYDYSKLNIEFGFFILISFLSLFGTSHFYLFSVIALLAVYCNLKAIRFFSPYFGASVLIYFSHLFFAKELNAIRIGLASAIGFYATIFLYKKKKAIFSLLFFLAVSIHVSVAILLIPALLWIISPRRIYIFYIGISIVGVVYFYDISHFLTQFIDFGAFESKIDQYANVSEYNRAIPLTDTVNLRNLILVGFGLLFWEKFFAVNEKAKFAFYFFFAATFFRILFGDFAIIAGRGYGAISMFEVILIPGAFLFIFGNKVGYFLIGIFALVTLTLNLYVNTGWSGGGFYFNELL